MLTIMHINQAGYSQSPKTQILDIRKKLQAEIGSQRAESRDLLERGEITKDQYQQNQEFLNQYDLDRAKARTDRYAKTVRNIIGLAVGTAAGYQGGWAGGIVGGLSGASLSDGLLNPTDTSVGLTLLSSVAASAAGAIAGSTGGIAGAVAGGISAVLASNYGEVPTLLLVPFV